MGCGASSLGAQDEAFRTSGKQAQQLDTVRELLAMDAGADVALAVVAKFGESSLVKTLLAEMTPEAIQAQAGDGAGRVFKQ